MSTADTVRARQWVSASEAAMILGCSRERVAKFVADGLLTRRTLPGAWSVYPLDEVEAFAARHTTPARAKGGP